LRAAILSDVHANLPALEATLAAVDEAKVDEIWCLGDIVGYGADPDACTALVRERCDICLVGNHDLAVLGSIDISSFSSTAAVAAEWTRENASEATLEFLRGLKPVGTRLGVGLFHASPRDPIWEYVLSLDQADDALDAQKERLGLIGHSHVPLFFTRQEPGLPGETHGDQTSEGTVLDINTGRWLINPGSVGQPRDGDPRAAWLALDLGERTAHFHRVEYEIDRAVAAIVGAGLPVPLGERLQVGR